jgi:prolyl-tRNA editing enzyme YbaK/EbsC (Cys-tRNA(Pro) deacylase)
MTDASAARADHPSVRRVREAAERASLPIEIRLFAEGTRTAVDAARAVGCDVSQIVKSLVFMADGTATLALVSGADRLDPARLAGVLGADHVRRADGHEVRAATGYAIGGVPPIGHTEHVMVVMDARLLAHPVVWAAAGLPDAVFAVEPGALAAAAGARVADVAEVSEPA